MKNPRDDDDDDDASLLLLWLLLRLMMLYCFTVLLTPVHVFSCHPSEYIPKRQVPDSQVFDWEIQGLSCVRNWVQSPVV